MKSALEGSQLIQHEYLIKFKQIMQYRAAVCVSVRVCVSVCICMSRAHASSFSFFASLTWVSLQCWSSLGWTLLSFGVLGHTTVNYFIFMLSFCCQQVESCVTAIQLWYIKDTKRATHLLGAIVSDATKMWPHRPLNNLFIFRKVSDERVKSFF